MLRKLLLISSLFSVLVVVTLATLFYTPLGTRLVVAGLDRYPQPALSIGSLSGSLGRSFQLADLRIKTSALEVRIDKLSLVFSPWAILRGKISLSSLRAVELAFYFKESKEPPAPPSTEPFILPLPEELLPHLSLGVDDLQIDGIAFYSPAGNKVEYLDAAYLSATVSGKDIVIDRLEVDDPKYAAKVWGKATSGATWWADLQGKWRFSNWDGGELLGELTTKGPLPNMDVTVTLNAPTRVDIKGKMTRLPGNPYFQLTGRGVKTALPVIHPAIPDIRLDAFLKAWGYINDYHGHLLSKGEYWKFKGIDADLRLDGNFDNIHFKDVRFRHQKTIVDITGCYLDWEDDFMVGGVLDVQHFNPGVAEPLFYGDISGVIDGKLTVGDKVWGWYTLKDIAGTLRGQPLAGDLALRFTEDDFDLDRLFLRSDKSQLLYSGHFAENQEMKLEVEDFDLNKIRPELAGLVSGSLNLSGSYQQPRVDGTLLGEELQFWDFNIASAQAQLQRVPFTGSGGNLQITATDLQGYTVDGRSAHVDFQGSLAQHHGRLSLVGDEQKLDFDFSGTLADSWQLSWRNIDLQLPYLGSWQGTKPFDFRLTTDTVALAGSLGQSQAEISGEVFCDFDLEKSPYDLNFSLIDFTIPDILGRSDNGSGVGTLSLKGELSAQQGQLLSSSFSSSLRDLKLVIPGIGENREHVKNISLFIDSHYNDGILRSTLRTQSAAEQATLDLSAVWNGSWDVDLAHVELQGEGKVLGLPLEPLGGLTGYLVESAGTVSGDISLGGTLAAPQLAAQVKLDNDEISLPGQGVALTDVKLGLRSEDGKLLVDGSFAAGAGRAVASGVLNWYQQTFTSGSLQLRGHDLQLVDLPEYSIVGTPDLQIDFTPQAMDISGSIMIPKASIKPKSGASGQSESEDVVFLNVKGKSESVYQIRSSLQIDLGDDIEFSQFGLKGRLAGSFHFDDEPSNPMTATGELELVDGSFNAYGRSLDITRGKLLFTGGPVTNPAVDARAQKEVLIQTDMRGKYVVGVDINGLASNLNYTLFSSPYMDDADILSYLLLGHSLFGVKDDDANVVAEAAQTIGWKNGANTIRRISSVIPIDNIHLENDLDDQDMSLVLGKNITRQLYVGYDYNVVDQVGELQLRYDLENGFLIETKSSSEATGADILYIFER